MRRRRRLALWGPGAPSNRALLPRTHTDRLVARFLAEEQVNFELYSYIATVTEDAEGIEAMLAEVHREIAAGQDSHALRLHQQVRAAASAAPRPFVL